LRAVSSSWVAQHGRGEPEPLGHAEREAADPLLGGGGLADHLDHGINPLARDAIALRQRQQMGTGRAPPWTFLASSSAPDLVPTSPD
jgi:hypothetical protein